jgi:hypothetical protein
VPQINQNSLMNIQPELTSGESILWAGQPSTHVVFHKEDALLIPFSLMWGGFAVFWEAQVAGYGGGRRPWEFGLVWGIPFVLIGQYLIWGRFLQAAWKKKRTHYAVTNRRVIAVQDGWRRQVASAFIDTLPALIKEGGFRGIGTLRFAQQESIWSGKAGWGPWDAMAMGVVPTFADVDDVDSVYRLVSDLREKTKTGTSTTF